MKQLSGWPLAIATAALTAANVVVVLTPGVPQVVSALLAGLIAGFAVLGVSVRR